jgi:hypothetical protein
MVEESTMKANQPVVILILLTLTISSIASASGPNLLDGHTLLAVKQANGQWGDSRTIHSLTTLTFEWKSDVPNTNFGQWQLLDYAPGPHDLTAQPFAVSGPLAASPANQLKQFTIDFAQMHQEHPDKVPAVASSAPKNFYVRLVPWKTQDMSDPANIAGHVSLNMKITLVSSISTGNGDEPGIVTGFKIDSASVDIRCPVILAGAAVAFVRTSKPSFLVFQVSESAPVLDSHQHPTFPLSAIAASEHVSSFNTIHLVALFGLKNETHYFYIIEVRDSVGHQTFSQGELTAHSRQLTP